MKFKNKCALLSIITLTCFSPWSYGSTFTSNIFSYEKWDDNSLTLPRLHVNLQTDRCVVADIQEKDIAFHQDLFGDREVMKRFGNGKPRDREKVKERCLDSINNRFGKGYPHGLLVVRLKEEEDPFMHVVAGGGDRPGTSETALAMIAKHHGKGLGYEVENAVVNVLAVKMAQIGNGIDLDPLNPFDSKIIQGFQCFGGKALDQIDATVDFSNVPSKKVFDKLQFEAAASDLKETEIVLDYDGKEYNGNVIKQYTAMREDVLKSFDPSNSGNTLEKGKRMRMIDLEGKLRTFSYSLTWEDLRFHLEKKVKY